MFPLKTQLHDQAESKTYPLDQQSEHFQDGPPMALVALSHSPLEHRIYLAMLSQDSDNGKPPHVFTTRRLMELTGIRSQSTIRRGLEGLILKLSIERQKRLVNSSRGPGLTYKVFRAEEIIARRIRNGSVISAKGIEGHKVNPSYQRAISKVAENRNLSRREAQVALCCVEGLTNAEIGKRLQVSEQTVKFHLRHVFIKFAVKRRAELISRLLM